MEHQNHNTDSRKNLKERCTIELRLKDRNRPYKIAKINTVLNEIRRGTTTQIKQDRYVEMYLADTDEANYNRNLLNSCRSIKRLECSEFISYTVNQIKENSWSPDACFGEALKSGRFSSSEMVCTKNLYNYIDLGLLNVKNCDLSLKLHRNTKHSIVKKNKKYFGKSIAESPSDIELRAEFGHWEIDTVLGEKTTDDPVLMTLVERKTRNAIVRRTPSKTAEALKNICSYFSEKFSSVFKTITGDKGSEFADLSTIEGLGNTKVYFTHTYSSFEKGTNERHNGLIRRFIPKGKLMRNYSLDDIAFIEEWMNTLSRKILD